MIENQNILKQSNHKQINIQKTERKLAIEYKYNTLIKEEQIFQIKTLKVKDVQKSKTNIVEF